jgi:hypothetical protein
MFKKSINSLNPKHAALPFALSELNGSSFSRVSRRSGFLKVVAGGSVVRLCEHKPLVDRMLGDGVTKVLNSTNASSKTAKKIILQSVVTNLEAGVQLLDKQEFVLARIGGRLSEMALALNRSRANPDHSSDAQIKFEKSRAQYRTFIKETFDHTALFSFGASKPVIVAIPKLEYWELLSIDRCNIDRPGLRSLDAGKVSPAADGLLLDPEAFSRAFSEWRFLCAVNRLQWNMINSHWQSYSSKLANFANGDGIALPPLFQDLSTLLSSHSYFNN